jgi:multiple antibiotic resistance protein
MKLESLDAAFVIDTFLLLLIGIGPKIALVPFLEATKQMPEATKRRVLRKMLTTATPRLAIAAGRPIPAAGPVPPPGPG